MHEVLPSAYHLGCRRARAERLNDLPQVRTRKSVRAQLESLHNNATATHSEAEWRRFMQSMRNLCAEAYHYLESLPAAEWALCKCKHTTFGMCTAQLADAMHADLPNLCAKPVPKMMREIVSWTNQVATPDTLAALLVRLPCLCG